MKNLLLTVALFVFASTSFAQKTIAVLSGTTWTFYDDFSPALRAAPAGSIIYLPGGTFAISDNADTINKPLTIIGAGFSLDSAGATGITRLLGTLLLDNGSDYTTLEGIRVDYVSSLSNNSIYSNILIKRCDIGYLNFLASSTSYGKNYYVTESVICQFNGGSDPWNGIMHYNNLKVEKSVILYWFSGCYGATFNNNIILTVYSNNATTYNNACEFNNNIFVDSVYTYEVASNSIFNNNIFRTGNSTWGATGNVYIGCVWNKPPASIFINPPLFNNGGCDPVYNPSYNFHLKTSSPAKNFGTDGTDAGIYGTSSPCKDGWIPSNPHVSFKTIAPSSLSNGTLPVTIKVAAQDR